MSPLNKVHQPSASVRTADLADVACADRDRVVGIADRATRGDREIREIPILTEPVLYV